MTDLAELVEGATATVRLTYTDADGATGVDPPALTVKYRRMYGDPAVSKVWQTDAAVVRDGAGQFHIDVPCPEAGTWVLRADDGDGGVDEFTWDVTDSALD